MIRLQVAEAPVELIVVRDRPSVVTGHVFHPCHSNLRCLSQPVPTLIGTGTNDQPVKPGVPAFGISQIGKALPGMDERLLDRVLRLVRVAKDQPRERQETGDAADARTSNAS